MLRRLPLWFLLVVAAISLAGVGTRLAMVAFVHEPSQAGYLVDYDPIFALTISTPRADDPGRWDFGGNTLDGRRSDAAHTLPGSLVCIPAS